jgi:hypothetical protein
MGVNIHIPLCCNEIYQQIDIVPKVMRMRNGVWGFTKRNVIVEVGRECSQNVMR